jgi:hypothetical protein
MTKKSSSSILPKTLFPAIALALSIACAGQALSQGASSGGPGSPGTAGAGNAAAANDSLGGGGGGPPTMRGTGPGTTSPGGINSAPEPGSPAPSARPNQVPDTAGASNTSTTPPTGTVGMTTGRIPGHTGRVSTVQEQSDPGIDETEKEVSKRIKNICRGC